MSKVERDDYVRYEDKNKLKAENLSTEQRQFLVQLNEKLVDIEKGIKKECQALIEELEKRIANPDDWLEDYEIVCDITFCLKEDDPEYSENSDNILAELSEHFKSEYPCRGIADGNNHNETQFWDHPMKDEHHCWLYHCLYDHTHLGWIDLLRIGTIWVDIHVYYQKFYEL